jgi:ribonuclease HII
MKYLVGIDEVGRGPLAGPVAIGIVKVPATFDWRLIPGVTDSKKLTSSERARIMKVAQDLRHRGLLDFTVAQVGASVIDEAGISVAIRQAMVRAITRLGLKPSDTSFRLDGSLYAPPEFKQATIIKGDALYPEIGLASIVAKETRDAYMRRIARRYPRYGFAEHMGYGTAAHRTAIRTYGLSPIHRVTYCRKTIATKP